MQVAGTINLRGIQSERTERVPGRLLRRVSLLHDLPRADYATVSNNYDRPDHPNATLPDGLFLNYTPASDDSIIRVRVGVHLYRGGSNSDGYSVRNEYYMFRYMWQFGDEAYGHEFHREYDAQAYRIFKIEVPSWGKGKSRPVRWRVVNHNASGYWRLNLYYNAMNNDTMSRHFDGRRTLSQAPQICVEEYSATEPDSTPAILWNPANIDY